MTNARHELEVSETPICAAVERDLQMVIADLLAPRKTWSFQEYDAEVRRRLGLQSTGFFLGARG